MRRAEITRRFDEIVAFSEIEKFLDTPVKRYSSGMYMRLAFAVAAHLDTDVLIVDEVLAVGDAEFQRKCLGKMSAVASGGRTILFVSHNMAAVERLCSRVILLQDAPRTFWTPRCQISLSEAVCDTMKRPRAARRANGPMRFPGKRTANICGGFLRSVGRKLVGHD